MCQEDRHSCLSRNTVKQWTDKNVCPPVLRNAGQRSAGFSSGGFCAAGASPGGARSAERCRAREAPASTCESRSETTTPARSRPPGSPPAHPKPPRSRFAGPTSSAAFAGPRLPTWRATAWLQPRLRSPRRSPSQPLPRPCPASANAASAATGTTAINSGGANAKASRNAYSALHRGQRTSAAESTIAGIVTCFRQLGQVEIVDISELQLS